MHFAPPLQDLRLRSDWRLPLWCECLYLVSSTIWMTCFTTSPSPRHFLTFFCFDVTRWPVCLSFWKPRRSSWALLEGAHVHISLFSEFSDVSPWSRALENMSLVGVPNLIYSIPFHQTPATSWRHLVEILTWLSCQGHKIFITKQIWMIPSKLFTLRSKKRWTLLTLAWMRRSKIELIRRQS